MEENVKNKIKIANLMSSEIAIIAPKWFPLLEFKKYTDESGFEVYRYDELIPEAEEIRDLLLSKYEEWCTRCRELFNQYSPEYLEDFNNSYEIVMSILNFEYKVKRPNSQKLFFEFNKYFKNQQSALSHLSTKLRR